MRWWFGNGALYTLTHLKCAEEFSHSFCFLFSWVHKEEVYRRFVYLDWDEHETREVKNNNGGNWFCYLLLSFLLTQINNNVNVVDDGDRTKGDKWIFNRFTVNGDERVVKTTRACQTRKVSDSLHIKTISWLMRDRSSINNDFGHDDN